MMQDSKFLSSLLKLVFPVRLPCVANHPLVENLIDYGLYLKLEREALLENTARQRLAARIACLSVAFYHCLAAKSNDPDQARRW